MSLGQFISTKRRKMHLTQEELADRMHVSKSAIAKWETDGGIPDRDNLKRLSKVMGISIDDIHKIIDSNDNEHVLVEVNITHEVIAALESYGYKIIRPGENDSSTYKNQAD